MYHGVITHGCSAMTNLVTRCPACSSHLQATRLTCSQCGTQLEGAFDIPALLRLPREDIEFITAFVRNSGSLKAMAVWSGTSYPTVRNRLNDIVTRLDAADRDVEQERHSILDAVQKGTMTAEEAARALRKVGR